MNPLVINNKIKIGSLVKICGDIAPVVHVTSSYGIHSEGIGIFLGYVKEEGEGWLSDFTGGWFVLTKNGVEKFLKPYWEVKKIDEN